MRGGRTLKNYMYIFFLMFLFFSFVFPKNAFAETVSSPEPYDYTNGLLDDENIILSNELPTELYDNNLSTFFRIRDTNKFVVKFKNFVHIEGVYYSAEFLYSAGSHITFTYFDEEEKKIMSAIHSDYALNGYRDVSIKNVIAIEIGRFGTSGTIKLKEIDFFGTYSKSPILKEVDNLVANELDGSIELSYTIPNGISHVNIYQNDELIAENVTENRYLIEGLTNGVEYLYKVTTVNEEGYESNGVIIAATPKEPTKEIMDLNVEPKHNRVNLSWQNPNYDGFHHVKIYRKDNVSKQNPFMLFGSIVYADDDFKPIFETNGTYFNDLTVEPDTTYEYKLTTNTEDGIESEGVTIKVTTPPEPPPKMGGVEQEEDENGDYVFKWTSPTEGTVKILVGGEEYATVPASDGRITIPKDDMKYTPLGNPDVRLVPISESGKEGSPTYPGTVGGGGSIKIPFTPKDVLTSAVQLFGVVGPFLFLILAIYVTRVYLIPLIRKSASKREVREGRRFRT